MEKQDNPYKPIKIGALGQVPLIIGLPTTIVSFFTIIVGFVWVYDHYHRWYYELPFRWWM